MIHSHMSLLAGTDHYCVDKVLSRDKPIGASPQLGSGAAFLELVMMI